MTGFFENLDEEMRREAAVKNPRSAVLASQMEAEKRFGQFIARNSDRVDILEEDIRTIAFKYATQYEVDEEMVYNATISYLIKDANMDEDEFSVETMDDGSWGEIIPGMAELLGFMEDDGHDELAAQWRDRLEGMPADEQVYLYDDMVQDYANNQESPESMWDMDPNQYEAWDKASRTMREAAGDKDAILDQLQTAMLGDDESRRQELTAAFWDCCGMGDKYRAKMQGTNSSPEKIKAWADAENEKIDAKMASCDCWDGYKRVPGTKPCAPGSCEKCDADRDKKEAAIEQFMMQHEAALIPESLRKRMDEFPNRADFARSHRPLETPSPAVKHIQDSNRQTQNAVQVNPQFNQEDGSSWPVVNPPKDEDSDQPTTRIDGMLNLDEGGLVLDPSKGVVNRDDEQPTTEIPQQEGDAAQDLVDVYDLEPEKKDYEPEETYEEKMKRWYLSGTQMDEKTATILVESIAEMAQLQMNEPGLPVADSDPDHVDPDSPIGGKEGDKYQNWDVEDKQKELGLEHQDFTDFGDGPREFEQPGGEAPYSDNDERTEKNKDKYKGDADRSDMSAKRVKQEDNVPKASSAGVESSRKVGSLENPTETVQHLLNEETMGSDGGAYRPYDHIFAMLMHHQMRSSADMAGWAVENVIGPYNQSIIQEGQDNNWDVSDEWIDESQIDWRLIWNDVVQTFMRYAADSREKFNESNEIDEDGYSLDENGNKVIYFGPEPEAYERYLEN